MDFLPRLLTGGFIMVLIFGATAALGFVWTVWFQADERDGWKLLAALFISSGWLTVAYYLGSVLVASRLPS